MINNIIKWFNKDPIIQFHLAYPKMIKIFPEPKPAIADVPEWYKKQPSHYNNDRSLVNGVMQLTVKKCQAIFDGMTSGYFLLAPVDIYIDTTDNKTSIEIPEAFRKLNQPILGVHGTSQISEYPLDKDLYLENLLRIHPVWLVSTPKGYSTLFMPPMHYDLPIQAVPAIIDSDSFYSDGLLSYFVKKNYKGVIKQGTPIVQVFPFKREKWQSKINEDFDTGLLYEQRKNLRSTFENGYRLKFWKKKQYQ